MLILAALTAVTLTMHLNQTRGSLAASTSALSLLDLPVFAGLTAATNLLRRSPGNHKRLMILATVAIIGAAVIDCPSPRHSTARGYGLRSWTVSWWYSSLAMLHPRVGLPSLR